jgi:hypothetical protein
MWAALGMVGLVSGVQAQTRDTVIYPLGQIVVLGRVDDLTSVANTASQGYVGARDLRQRPLSREGELLETVPGLIMTQHSGDGKSNQMFVRGFNLDHGTDFHTRVEGMPVNVVTHAHGQGYTDLNFIIPEFVDHIEYWLGTYYAGIGDFGAAGGAEFRYRKTLDRPFISGGLGANGFARVAAGASTALFGGDLLAGGELKDYDGPWNLPQNLQKMSGLVRWSRAAGAHSFSLLALGYDNRWNASDQVPLRLLNARAIDRFSQIDSTLGGESYRYSLSGEWVRSAGQGGQRAQVYAIHSDLDLFSNFTYFLDNGGEGDQIRQRDRGRWTFGANAVHVQPLTRNGAHQLTFGLQTRYDIADVALYRARSRVATQTVRADDVKEWGTGAYVEATSRWTPTLRTMLGLRADGYTFDVQSDNPANSGTASDAIVSPKASVIFQASPRTELYASAGLGFHSNDARGTTQRFDPSSGEAVDPVDPLVPSRGAELGLRAALLSGLRTTLALWAVELDSELLFVGDAGTTEPSDGSRRVGVTLANFWRVTPELSTDLDVSFTRARFVDVDAGADRIPGALENVIAAGFSWEPLGNGLLAALRLRHLGAHPLIEDNSVRGDPASIVNLSAGYRRGPMRVTAALLNLLDSRDADILYFYASRLRTEPVGGVEDIHIHPIEPRQLRVTVSVGF